jgi:hypothetical protein
MIIVESRMPQHRADELADVLLCRRPLWWRLAEPALLAAGFFALGAVWGVIWGMG